MINIKKIIGFFYLLGDVNKLDFKNKFIQSLAIKYLTKLKFPSQQICN